MSDSNLMSQSSRQRVARTDQVRSWTYWLIRYGGLLLLAGVVCAASLHTPSSVPADQVELVELRAKESEQRQVALRAKLAEVRRLHDNARAIGEHPDWSLLLAIIQQARGSKIEIHSIELLPVAGPAKAKEANANATATNAPLQPAPPGPRPARYSVRLGGLAGDHSELAAFVLRLEALPIFVRVGLVDNRAEQPDAAQDDHRPMLVRYTIEGELDDAPKPATKGGGPASTAGTSRVASPTAEATATVKEGRP